mmetsp:Transcript_13538/g.25405  ORF Transcript_13538/g.25405 Transcript_13538/m.25405 type:complete len:204 (-) Transcript_13538:691-1302(-)
MTHGGYIIRLRTIRYVIPSLVKFGSCIHCYLIPWLKHGRINGCKKHWLSLIYSIRFVHPIRFPSCRSFCSLCRSETPSQVRIQQLLLTMYLLWNVVPLGIHNRGIIHGKSTTDIPCKRCVISALWNFHNFTLSTNPTRTLHGRNDIILERDHICPPNNNIWLHELNGSQSQPNISRHMTIVFITRITQYVTTSSQVILGYFII